MTFSLEGFGAIGESINKSLDDSEKKNPVITGIGETTASVLLGATAVLAVKSGLTRLANNEATYGGFGPVLTVAAGVTSGVAAIWTGIRSYNVGKEIVAYQKKHLAAKKAAAEKEAASEASKAD